MGTTSVLSQTLSAVQTDSTSGGMKRALKGRGAHKRRSIPLPSALLPCSLHTKLTLFSLLALQSCPLITFEARTIVRKASWSVGLCEPRHASTHHFLPLHAGRPHPPTSGAFILLILQNVNLASAYRSWLPFLIWKSHGCFFHLEGARGAYNLRRDQAEGGFTRVEDREGEEFFRLFQLAEERGGEVCGEERGGGWTS